MLGKVDIESFLSSIPSLKENLTLGNLDFQSKNSISWLKEVKFYPKFKQGYLILTENEWKQIDKINPKIIHIISNSSPRLEFAKILQKYFHTKIHNFGSYFQFLTPVFDRSVDFLSLQTVLA